MNNELYHHGIKGQRWGIRRYQDYDGSYTQAGLKRYREQQQLADDAKAAYKKTKDDYKSGKVSREDLSAAKIKYKREKKYADDAYRHLSIDKRADKGKKLYQKGDRILTSRFMTNIGRFGVYALTAGAYQAARDSGARFVNGPLKNVYMKDVIAAGGLATMAGLETAHQIKRRRLDAYYSHTNWKRPRR